ncbi:MAG: glutamate-5-semialdehyde dehydrogenase [Acidobacteria bacterium]|nr:glutamate-5-semialdehyde dehydrogenase [Acidobacteriota bacterium]
MTQDLFRPMNTEQKNNVLKSLARLLGEHQAEIVAANARDLAGCPAADPVIYDRLKVDAAKVARMIAAVESVAAAADPENRLVYSTTRADGLRIENRTVPFGRILIIYEARPDVTIEAAVIALKAGNRILLKGGKEARQTNLALVGLWKQALVENGADAGFVEYLDLARDETRELIAGRREHFDVVIPRGGETLIDFVLKNSKAPVIVSGRGNNFAFVDADADFEKALPIVLNGKSRLSVCNALDKVLLDENIPGLDEKIARLVEALKNIGVEVLGDDRTAHDHEDVALFFGDEIWFEEFLAAKIVVAVVSGLAEAIEKINKYSGGHSAVIVTENAERAERFMAETDCAAVYHNASTRFTDGGEFGLGAEIAISTQKLHFRGPLGAEHLLTNKWFVYGDGQIRQ